MFIMIGNPENSIFHDPDHVFETPEKTKMRHGEERTHGHKPNVC